MLWGESVYERHSSLVERKHCPSEVSSAFICVVCVRWKGCLASLIEMGPKSDKKGGGGGVKRKHVQLSIKDKLKILDQLENGTKPGVISLEFGIAKQTISDIKRNGEKLRK